MLANGPVRAIFELSYDAWDAQGRKVSETKRYTVDAGHNLDQVESTFKVVEGAVSDLTVGIGLDKNSADKGQEPRTELTSRVEDGSLAMWVSQRTNGSIGTAVIVPRESFLGFAADEMNELVLARAAPGKSLRYYAGAGWSKAGEFTFRESWDAYVAACVARIGSPVTISFSVVP